MRIDDVFSKLVEIATPDKGVTTQQLTKILGFSRTNVSSDLNRLVADGKIRKKPGKPVLYFPVIDTGAAQKVQGERLDAFLQKNTSLFSVIEQAKAAVLYPPKGMNILILGETGVGKSMFAELIFDYAKEVDIISRQAELMIFNCADYANNPQLLLSQLFGCKKGTYTGAYEDRIGLLEKAHNSILFLDEVHRLPPEGQEMFFTFIDKGIFHRLGESDKAREANVRIIAATTEEPSSSLLRTFSRRFPMTLYLPSLAERTIQERFDLIQFFFNQEARLLNSHIVVSLNTIRALLCYECINNVGQLKSDIRFICALAYAKGLASKQSMIEINSGLLPTHINSVLLSDISHRQIWNQVVGNRSHSMVFTGEYRDEPFLHDQTEDIYHYLNLRLLALQQQGIEGKLLDDEIEREIAGYFYKHLEDKNKKCDLQKLNNIVSRKTLVLVEKIIECSHKQLTQPLNKKFYYGLATHLEYMLERGEKGTKIQNPQLNKIRTHHPKEFNVALDCIKMIERSMGITLSLDEVGYLAMFFIYSQSDVTLMKKGVQVIVVAHGVNTASAIVETANTLLDVNYAVAFDVPLQETAQNVLEKIVSYINSRVIKTDTILLVDMGSLTTFGVEIERCCQIKTATLELTSTLHVIEAIQSAMKGLSLTEVYKEVTSVYHLLPKDERDHQNEKSLIDKRLAILILGGADKAAAQETKVYLMQSLSYRKNILDIISVDISKQGLDCSINTVSQTHHIVALVSSDSLATNLVQFSQQEILTPEGIDAIQKLIDIEMVYSITEEGLREVLTTEHSEALFAGIRTFNERVIKQLQIEPSTNTLIGLIMHLGCLFERLHQNALSFIFANKKQYIEENSEIISILRKEVSCFEELFSYFISDDELCSIAKILKG